MQIQLHGPADAPGRHDSPLGSVLCSHSETGPLPGPQGVSVFCPRPDRTRAKAARQTAGTEREPSSLCRQFSWYELQEIIACTWKGIGLVQRFSWEINNRAGHRPQVTDDRFQDRVIG